MQDDTQDDIKDDTQATFKRVFKGTPKGKGTSNRSWKGTPLLSSSGLVWSRSGSVYSSNLILYL